MSAHKYPNGLWLKKKHIFENCFFTALRIVSAANQHHFVCLPVRTHVQKTSFRATGLYVTVGVASTTPLVGGSKTLFVSMLSVQNRSKTDRSLERPPKKTSRPRPETHLLRAGPGRGKLVVFTVSEKRTTPGFAFCKMSKSWVGPKVPKSPLACKRSTFSKTVLF